MRTRPGTKPLLDERRFVPTTVEQTRELFEALVAVEVPEHIARSMVGTLQTLPPRYDNALHARVSRYRVELAKVGEPPWERLVSTSSTRDKGASISSLTKSARRRGGRRVGGSHWSGRLELAA